MTRRLHTRLVVGLGACAIVGAAWWAFDSPARAGANPLLRLQHDPADARALRGRVEQLLRAGSYSYLAVRSDDRRLGWAVTLGRGEPVGTRVSVRSVGHAEDFHSRRLARTFAHLTFGIVTPEH